MLDLQGTEVTAAEKELLGHPATGGVILFSRNFESPEQIQQITSQIHEIRKPALLIAVDQEGGRVQRFKEGFARLPAAARFGDLYQHDHQKALRITADIAWLMASELRSVGVDFSFAPVLDINSGLSQVIGDRAFHQNPAAISQLARAWMKGAHEAGMPSVGKHFPGHGCVEADSHHELPVDHRSYTDMEALDLLPFAELIEAGLDAIMPAHVIYDQIDPHLAGFSAFWLKDVLRKKMAFQGVIFSDDLTMAATESVGDYVDRANLSLEAGCDMILVCNNQPAAETVLDALVEYSNPVSQSRLARMHGRHQMTRQRLRLQPRYQNAMRHLSELEIDQTLTLSLDDPTDYT